MPNKYGLALFPPRRQCRGFTLIELVLVAVLLSILGATGVSMLYNPFATARIVNATNADATKSRYAMERVARELREVKLAGNAFCITSSLTPPQPNATFRNNTSSTTTDCSTGNQLIISWSGTPGDPLTMSLNGAAATVLVNNVTGFSLNFQTKDNTNTGVTASNVISVIINLTVTDSESGQPSAQRTRVFLRNAS